MAFHTLSLLQLKLCRLQVREKREGKWKRKRQRKKGKEWGRSEGSRKTGRERDEG